MKEKQARGLAAHDHGCLHTIVREPGTEATDMHMPGIGTLQRYTSVSLVLSVSNLDIF